jgi:hypothetical protein
MSIIKVDQDKVKLLHKTRRDAQRAAAYKAEADPIFFKMHRGEATLEEWEAKIAEIKSRFPGE